MTRRLLAGYLTMAAFVLMVLEVPLGVIFARSQQGDLIAAVERDATVIAGVSEDALERGVDVDLRSVATRYARRTGGRVVIVDRRGYAVADSDPPAPGVRDFSTRQEFAAALEGQVATGVRRSETLDTRLVYVAVPVTSGGVVHGAVRITYPTATIDARVRRNWLILLAVAVVVLAAAAVLSLVFARSVTRPLRDLQRTALRLSQGRLAARADPDEGPPEVRAVAAAFNTMALRLEELLGGQRAFVADASHQLRTPLTALRLRLENLAADVTEAGADELEAAIDETVRLGRLVEGLLTLARAEGSRVAVEPVDVGAALDERRAAWAPLVEEQGCDLALDVGRGLVATAVPGAVPQIVDNLIANATRYAPAGSTITLVARASAPWVELHVRDEGPGMSADDRARAFDRFWRRDGTQVEGFGLGLAIVERLATASGGHVALHEASGGGLDAQLDLPMAEADSGAVTPPDAAGDRPRQPVHDVHR